jgi:hypothetical protein
MLKNGQDPIVEAERRVGQALVALGQGAGVIRVSRGAVDAFRERYLEPVARQVNADWSEGCDRWREEGPNVLDRVRTQGRLAAQFAIEEGAMAVERRHLVAAVERVEGYHLGRWCPARAAEAQDAAPEEKRLH